MKHNPFFAKLSWFIVMIVAGLLAGCSVFSGTSSNETNAAPPVAQSKSGIIVEGHIVPREDASLFFTTGGGISEVLVQENDTVTKGDVLARLGDRESFEARLTSAQLELVSAQQAVNDLQTNAALQYSQALLESAAAERNYADAQEKLDEIDTDEYQTKLDDLRAAVADAKKELDDAQEEFDKYKDLDKDHPNRKNAEDALKAAQDKYNQAVRDRDRHINDLDQAKADMEMADARLKEAHRNRDARQNGPDPDEQALADARLANAKAQVTAAQADLNRLDLVAPFDGTIARIDISPGDRIVPNQVVMVIADFSTWYVKTSDLTENDVVSIEIGQIGRIIPDALPELELSGAVDKIASSYQEKAGDITYEVRLPLNESDPRLRWGMTVEVHFDSASP